MYCIYDTREPEGDGRAMRNEFGTVMQFDSERDAEQQLVILNVERDRVIIAPMEEDEERAVACTGSCGAPAGVHCDNDCSSFQVNGKN